MLDRFLVAAVLSIVLQPVDCYAADVQEEKKQSVSLVIYSDFQCGFCRQTAASIGELRRTYGNSLNIIFKHNPLPIHPSAFALHEQAAAAEEQGKFWEVHDFLFANQGAKPEQIRKFALQSGINLDAFERSLIRGQARSKVERDLAEARAYGVQGTPTLFLNGERIVGARDPAFLKRLIDKALGISKPVTLTTGLSPIRGNPSAPVTIHVFSDLQCPFCAKVSPELDQLLQEFPGAVRIVFKHFPLSFHKDAALAHEAAVIAGELGKFWEVHDALFRDQSNLTLPNLIRVGESLGLDGAKLRDSLESRQYRATVEADISEGIAAGVEGTPTLFVNGRPVVGARGALLSKMIADELAQRPQTTAQKKTN